MIVCDERHHGTIFAPLMGEEARDFQIGIDDTVHGCRFLDGLHIAILDFFHKEIENL